MSNALTLCPACGWTGSDADLTVDGDDRNCPACEYTIEER